VWVSTRAIVHEHDVPDIRVARERGVRRPYMCLGRRRRGGGLILRSSFPVRGGGRALTNRSLNAWPD
jgi:hypothetical protein